MVREVARAVRRAVAMIDGGKFKVETDAEQQVWNGCARLIANLDSSILAS